MSVDPGRDQAERAAGVAGAEDESRSDPVAEPSPSGDHPQARAGAAAAYAAAQHAAEVHVDRGGEAQVEAQLEDDLDSQTVAPAVTSVPGSEPSVAPDPDSAQGPALQPDLEELAARAQKADEYLSLAQRTQADFENYRKRAARDAALAQERGIAKLAKELLPAIDNLDRALAAALVYASGSADPEAASADPVDADGGDQAQAATSGPAAEDQLISGLRLVHAELLAALARAGIEPFSPVGEPFDPQHHEAVAQAPFEGQSSGTVVEVYQQGFRLGEAVLRPARVLVAA